MTAQEKNKIDCLLIHIGVPLIARGLYTIYYYLNNYNINTKLLIFDDNNDEILFEQLNSFPDVKLVGISMHWHPQIVSSIKITELLKCFENFRKSKIVFGGLTASIFKEELIQIPFVDFVIYGDGLLPIKLLYEHIINDENVDSLKNIPNLVYKKEDHVYVSDKVYIADDEILTKLELQAMEDKDLFEKSINVTAIGRGCDKKCLYCGGSKYSYKEYIGRSSPVIRKVDNIHKIVQKAIDRGIKSLYFAADYDGKCNLISDYLSPFDLSSFDSIMIGSWGLPDINNISSMLQNTKFPTNFYLRIEISPETGNEKSRKMIGGNYFSNRDLVNFMEMYFTHYPDFKLDIYFSFFLPRSKYFNIEEREFIIEIYKRFPECILNNKLRIYFLPLSTDPGSILQSGKVKGISVEVNSFNEYIDQMLHNKSNIGNFLKHFPKGYSKEDAEFLITLYLCENILREKYPKAFYAIIYFFDEFENYNQFLVSCVKDFNKIISESESNIFPIKNILGFDPFSILGFHYSSGEAYTNTSISRLLWLNTMINSLIATKKNMEKTRNKKVKKKIDLLDYIIEYFQVKISLMKNCIITYCLKNKKISYNIPKYSHLKIDFVKRFGLENCHIIPSINQFCSLVETKHLSIKYPILTPNDNLLNLGKTNFCKLLLNVHEDMIHKGKANRRSNVLDIKDLKSFHSNIPNYWENVLTNPNNEINIIFSELIVLANIPVEKILNLIPKNITQLHISNYFGILSDICSIELVNFFIHYYLYSKKIFSYELHVPDHTSRITYILMTSTGKSVHGYISPLENELCKLCAQNRTLSEIYSILKIKNNSLEKKVFVDMAIHLYNIGILI